MAEKSPNPPSSNASPSRPVLFIAGAVVVVLAAIGAALWLGRGGGGDEDPGRYSSDNQRAQAELEHQAIAERFEADLGDERPIGHYAEPARRLAAKYPDYADARALYGHVLHVMGRNDEALVELQAALELDPRQAEMEALAGSIAEALAMRAIAAGSIEAAAAARTKAQALHEQAVAHFRNAIYLDPKTTRFRLLLAQVYLDQREYDTARDVLIEALRQDQHAHAAHYMLARLYAEQGKTQMALDSVLKAIGTAGAVTDREDHVRYLREKSRLLRRLNRPEEALLTLRDNLWKQERLEPDVVAEMATCLLMLGRVGDAASLYEDAANAHLTDKPVQEKMLIEATRCRIRTNDLKIARAHLNRLRELSPELAELAELAADLNKAAQAGQEPVQHPNQ